MAEVVVEPSRRPNVDTLLVNEDGDDAWGGCVINAEAEEGANTLLPLLQFPVEVVAVALVLIALVVKHVVAGAGGDMPIGFSGNSEL
ncbi:hypothetical protein EV2_020252 [Malus domestica]